MIRKALRAHNMPAWLRALLLSLLDVTAVLAIQKQVLREMFYWQTLLPGWLFSSPGVYELVLWAGIFLALLYRPGSPLRLWERLLVLVFSAVALLGHSFSVCQDYALITAGLPSAMMSLVCLLGIASLSGLALTWIKHLAGKLSGGAGLPDLWSRHPFLLPFLSISLLWLPWLLVKYPGSMDFDCYVQLLQGEGYYPLDDHNPLAGTLLFYGLFSAGRVLLGSNEAGLFFLTLAYALMCSACLGWCFRVMARLGVRSRYMKLALAASGLLPVFINYCTSLSKDGIFACGVVLWLSMLGDMLLGRREIRLWQTGLLALAGAGMCLLRNVPYLMPLMALALLILYLASRDRVRLSAMAAMLAAWGLCLVFYNGVVPALGAEPAPSSASLSMPLMQTARYVTYLPDEVTDEERQAISRVLDYERIPELYSPKLADSLKGNFHGDGEDIAGYLKVWAKMGLKHPEVYFSATFNNVYGFFCIGVQEDAGGIYMQYAPMSDAPAQLFSLDEEAATARSDLLDLLSQWLRAAAYFPPLLLLCSTAFHLWASVYIAIYSFGSRAWERLLLCLPSLGTALACVAMPTFFHNGARYALSIIFADLLLFGLLTIKKAGTDPDKESGERKGELV